MFVDAGIEEPRGDAMAQLSADFGRIPTPIWPEGAHDGQKFWTAASI